MQEAEAMAMDRSKSVTHGAIRASQVTDPEFQRDFPSLHEFLTEVAWSDGKPRQTGTLMVMAEAGWWKVWLHDRDGKVGGFVAGASWDEVLLTAEGQLSTGTVQWRADKSIRG
jgi:hypothetical protein